jgi:hypothetical protein
MLKLVSIALLCVQNSPADQPPTMSSANVMLIGDTVSVQVSSRPAFCRWVGFQLGWVAVQEEVECNNVAE